MNDFITAVTFLFQKMLDIWNFAISSWVTGLPLLIGIFALVVRIIGRIRGNEREV